ncbi:MAG TPA: NifB/NifX family molybdenum-iron cluster-binding protein [Desulfuromonadales bacterium]|jgi:predicted Fe-Mo cluster-binding NifX family protein
MRIAVATKSGTEVDQHFGHAERFLIYDFNQGSPHRVGEVQVEKYCSFDPDHPFRHRQFDAIVEALHGCKAVVTAMIGDYPRQELKKAGLFHVAATGPIEAALQAAHGELCGCACQGPKKCDKS